VTLKTIVNTVHLLLYLCMLNDELFVAVRARLLKPSRQIADSLPFAATRPSGPAAELHAVSYGGRSGSEQAALMHTATPRNQPIKANSLKLPLYEYGAHGFVRFS
jgi:hypothetical protein